MSDELTIIAEKIMQSQAFSYPSFAAAKHEIQFVLNGRSCHWCYDRLSLCVYEHDLSYREYWQLGRFISSWKDQHDREEVKARLEYGILFHYIRFHKEMFLATIQKETRPDFVLTLGDGKTIGIEVTRLTKQSDSIVSSIIQKYADSRLSPREVDRRAKAEHGEKANTVRIGRLPSGELWCFDQSGFLLSDAPFIRIVSKKISGYCEMVESFDQFIVLCNAQSGITITSKTDAEDFLCGIASENPAIDMTIAVLYLDATNQLFCSEICLAE